MCFGIYSFNLVGHCSREVAMAPCFAEILDNEARMYLFDVLSPIRSALKAPFVEVGAAAETEQPFSEFEWQ